MATSTNLLSARELTRRLVARATAGSDAPDSAALAIHAACERTYRELNRSLGTPGSRALLTRAMAQAQAQHPLLAALVIGHQSEAVLEGVPALVQSHGASAVAEGLEAVLETLLGLLGRLIGDDMVTRLVEQSTPIETQDDEDVK